MAVLGLFGGDGKKQAENSYGDSLTMQQLGLFGGQEEEEKEKKRRRIY